MRKNSFNFEIEAKGPAYVAARKHKKSKNLLFYIVFSVTLVMCVVIVQVVKSVPVIKIERGKEQIIKSIPLPDIEKRRVSDYQVRSEQEVQNLLSQQYIDPLTDYIETHQRNVDKSKYVQVIKEERDRRCGEIKKLYLQRRKDQVTLARLRKSYTYSCPEVVASFGESSQEDRVSNSKTAVKEADFL